MRVLLLTYNYAPSNAMGAGRTTSLARYLGSRGHQVRVIACGPSDTVPGQVSPHDGVTVRRIADQTGFVDSLYARLRGGDPTPDIATQGPPASQASGHEASRLISLMGRSILHLPDPSRRWSRRAFDASVLASHDWPPDVIVVSGPPFSSFIAASRLSRRLNVPWVADYRDLWSNSTYYPYPAPRRSVDKLLERVTLRGAASLVTVSEPLAEDLQRLHDRPASVVLNGHEPGSNDVDKQERLAGGLNLVYTGQLYPGRRDPRPLFDAIVLLGPEGAGIRVHFAGPHGEQATESAHLAGCPDAVVDHGQIEHAQALRLQQRADVLLLLMWNNIGDAGVYSGKLFECLFARRPILMLGWPHGVAARLILSREAGVVLNDPVAIADQLRAWLSAASSSGIQPLPASVTEGLTRDEQNSKFARIIEQAARLQPRQRRAQSRSQSPKQSR